MNPEPEILIFRTNIAQIHPDCKTSRALNAKREILEWSIDTEDVDCVLRIVSQLDAKTIISTINELGFECSELE
jgi:hypothetical protein